MPRLLLPLLLLALAVAAAADPAPLATGLKGPTGVAVRPDGVPIVAAGDGVYAVRAGKPERVPVPAVTPTAVAAVRRSPPSSGA